METSGVLIVSLDFSHEDCDSLMVSRFVNDKSGRLEHKPFNQIRGEEAHEIIEKLLKEE